jgi:hypothetical protein
MKKPLFLTAVLAIYIPNSHYVSAQVMGVKANDPVDVTPGISLSESIIFISHANNVNVLADATFFSTTNRIFPPQKEDPMQELLKLAYIDNLALRQLDEKKFLVWSEPDTSKIVNALIAEKQEANKIKVYIQKEKGGPSSLEFLNADIERQKIGLLLAEHLQRAHGWNAQSSDFNVNFKLSDLPTESAEALINLARSDRQKKTAQSQDAWPSDASWLSDTLWKSARIGYFQSPSKETFLAVRGSDGNRDYYFSLDRLTVPSSNEWKPTEDDSSSRDISKLGRELKLEALQSEKSLANPISLEMESVSLKSAVAEMQKLGGINLELTPDLLPDKKVTISIVKTPLHVAMNALSHLYGVQWAKAANESYIAYSGLSSLQIDTLQIGDYQWFRYWREPARRGFFPAGLQPPEVLDIRTELANSGVDEAQLIDTQGIALAALPAKVQELVRHNVERQISARLIDQYRVIFIGKKVPVIDESSVSIQVSPTTNRSMVKVGAKVINTGPALVATLIADGKEVCTVNIPNQQAWKGISSKIRACESWREKFNTQLPTAEGEQN